MSAAKVQPVERPNHWGRLYHGVNKAKAIAHALLRCSIEEGANLPLSIKELIGALHTEVHETHAAMIAHCNQRLVDEERVYQRRAARKTNRIRKAKRAKVKP